MVLIRRCAALRPSNAIDVTAAVNHTLNSIAKLWLEPLHPQGVYGHNAHRLHGYLDELPPAEVEQVFYAAYRTNQILVGIQYPESPSDPWDSN